MSHIWPRNAYRRRPLRSRYSCWIMVENCCGLARPPCEGSVRLRSLQEIRAVRRAHDDVQAGAAANGRQGHADAGGPQRPEMTVEFRQRGDFLIADLTDEIAFPNVG